MIELAIILAISTFMVLLTSVIHYEVLRITWDNLPRLTMSPRLRVSFVLVAIFAGHTISVWLYALLYWWLDGGPLGKLIGETEGGFIDALYFSVASYSSLGYGDIYPIGPMRMIAGIEVVNGLVLIGWSVSLTYLAMAKFWDLHRTQN